MFQVLISDNVAKECQDILQSSGKINVDFKTKQTPEELKSIIGNYDGLVVRSETKVRADVIAAAKKLKVVGRAGAGVDNIDVEKATEAGVVVMNTPGGNTVSTAEHTFSLIMALSRNIPQGDHSIKEGRWDRKKYMGVELRGKTLGIIGLGNIGREVAQRALAFKMKVVGVDPFTSRELAKRLGIELVSLDKLWEVSDYITVHTPLNESTKYLINTETLARCKNGVRIINCARGGIVNENDLLAAIESGKVYGAAPTFYEKEPPEGNPLVKHEKVICTPHLGASTTEAQDIVAVMIAEQMRDFLLSGEVRNAVNMPPMDPEVFKVIRPYINLSSRMGGMVGQLSEGQLKSVSITYFGEIHTVDTWPITSSALEGLLRRSYSEGVNMISARSIAEKQGITIDEIKSSEEKDYKNCIEITTKTDQGSITILGTIFGREESRVVRFKDFELDFSPEGHILICGNRDIPGIIGNVGTILGKKNINIAHMTWARHKPGGNAIVVLNTDEVVDKKTLDEVSKLNGIEWVKCLEL